MDLRVRTERRTERELRGSIRSYKKGREAMAGAAGSHDGRKLD